MFSGLTNQVSSWMGKAETDETAPATAEGGDKIASVQQPAAVPVVPIEEGAEGEKSGGMFSNFKTQMSGWSASIPTMPSMPAMPAMPSMPAMSIPSIPGLRKGAGEEGALEGEAPQNANGGEVATGEEEDKSSATEGADSHPSSPMNEEEAGKIGAVTTKVTQGAKTFGSFLYSTVNKAGAKVKETVKANPIMDSFNKEQDAFIKGQGRPGEAVLPWLQQANSEKVKEEILALSQDRRNFVRAPPAGVDFEFNYDISYPTAQAIMAEDPALEKMRFELVPKIITEENFWKNYFYRVSLICQAAELGTLGNDGMVQASSGEDGEHWEKDMEAELQEYEVVNDGASGGGDNNETTITTNLRHRSNPSDWEEYADLIDETDDLK